MSFNSDLARDVRYATRALAGSPRFTIVALLTVTVMVGGITAIFSLAHGVLLRPLPYPDADRLVVVESTQPKAFGTKVELADVAAFQQHSRSFDRWGLYRLGYVESLLDANNEPLAVQHTPVTPDVFSILGIEMARGRALLPSDADPGAPDVVVISHELWQTLFAGRDNVIGMTVNIRDKAFVIVGVTRPNVDLPMNWLTDPFIWRPVREARDGSQGFTVLARVREGVSLDQGKAELAVVAARLAAGHPETHQGRIAAVTLLLDKIVGRFKRVLWIFFGAVSCVLLIGVGNLTSLQLARNGVREREIGVRAALGGSRWRIMRQLVVESVVLCAAGGALGLGFAWMAIRLIVATAPRFPRSDQVGVDFDVALFAFGLSLFVGVVIGTIPAWHASRADLAIRLNEGGRSATAGASRGRMQRTLIAFQTAVALILLVGAGLLANSFYRLISRDAGMHEDGLWLASATLPSRYRDHTAQAAFWSSALEHVRAVRGVESAATVVNTTGPLSGNDMLEGGVVPEGVTASGRDGLRVSSRRVSESYFQTLGMPLLKGRPILNSDSAGAESVVVINELAATALWPGQDPLGKRLRSRGQLKTVVGVIPTFRHARLDGDLAPQMFTSFRQQPSIAGTAVIAFRTAPGNSGVTTAVQSTLMALEPELRVRSVSTMRDVRWKLLAEERFRATVLMTFATSAVFLAMVGIFGLVAYAVGQRKREFAVRVALGAVPRDILRVASHEAMWPAFLGLLLGVAGAAMATRLLSAYLVDIQSLDLATFVAAVTAVAIGAIVASLVPARQAVRIDPIEALRSE